MAARMTSVAGVVGANSAAALDFHNAANAEQTSNAGF
jgi:hypothetical protein